MSFVAWPTDQGTRYLSKRCSMIRWIFAKTKQTSLLFGSKNLSHKNEVIQKNGFLNEKNDFLRDKNDYLRDTNDYLEDKNDYLGDKNDYLRNKNGISGEYSHPLF